MNRCRGDTSYYGTKVGQFLTCVAVGLLPARTLFPIKSAKADKSAGYLVQAYTNGVTCFRKDFQRRDWQRSTYLMAKFTLALSLGTIPLNAQVLSVFLFQNPDCMLLIGQSEIRTLRLMNYGS